MHTPRHAPTCFAAALLALLAAAAAPDGGAAARRAHLDQLRRLLPPSAPWEEWLAKSGELPPEFASLPSRPGLPDPLTRENGRPVSSPEDWNARRAELKALFRRWVLGSAPERPAQMDAEVLEERREAGCVSRRVRLAFGPGGRARLRLELLIPEGQGPFPVFMTQDNHRGWALIALRRGYLACIYAGADSQDDTDSFREAYPEHDWSRLTRRAWAASRCIDYLERVPQADRRRIALTGHSRNGKLSLIASALDERIAAVISSSSGAGGALPARLFSEPQFGEGIENITRSFPEWFHPRFRFFAGREDRLPVDLNQLVAMSAPRPCLLSIALNDSVESTWAMQQTYLSARRAYRLLGAADRLRILWRPGGHETSPPVIERYLDWCDSRFGRGRHDFPERFVYPWDWDAWRRSAGPAGVGDAPPAAGDRPLAASRPAWEGRRAGIRREILAMLGEAPPRAAGPAGTYGREVPHVATLLGRGAAGDGIEKEQVVFGEYINADVYLPAGLKASGRKAPAVLWLHPLSFSNGYVAGYRRGEQFFRALAREGHVVFCFDQVGQGRRIEEAERFYERYPRWSLMGKMIRDAGQALETAMALPYVDARRVRAAGYGAGAMVGLHLAALDERLAGLAAVCGPQPLRPAAGSPDGVRRWSHDTMLLPRLGHFAGREERVPYDLGELLACAAPRPLLVVSPRLDREARVEDVTREVTRARAVYELAAAAERLRQAAPEDFNHFDPRMQAHVFRWLAELP